MSKRSKPTKRLHGNRRTGSRKLAEGKLLLETLEPRILYSGSPVPEAAPEPDDSTPEPAHVAPASLAPASSEVLLTPASDPTAAETPAPAVDEASEDPAVSGDEPGSESVAADPDLTTEVVQTVAEAAADRWAASGLSTEQTEALNQITYEIADLADGRLAKVHGFSITIDDDAGGQSWFIDQTPEDDSEFVSEIPAPEARDRLDLLTVLIHEQGHVLGLTDFTGGNSSDNVMDAYLKVGERNLPTANQAEGATPGSLQGERFMSGTPLTGATGPGGLAGAVPADLRLWLDGSDLDADGVVDALADGTVITEWLDKSGQGNDADGVIGTPFVIASGPGGQQSVGFSSAGGTDQLFTSYNFDNLGADYTMFAVSGYTGGDNERLITSKTRNWLFGHHGNRDERWYAEGWIHSTGTANSTDTNIYSGIIGPSVNGNAGDPGADFWVNGSQLTDNDAGSNNTNYKPGALALGAYTSGGESSNAQVAEVIIFDRALNDAERIIVQNYLNAKYEIDIGGEDFYDGALGYDIDLMGVGSASSNIAGEVLVNGGAGLGIAVDALGDGEFALAAHDGGVGRTSIGVPSGLETRWNREWYIDVTAAGTDGQLVFDFSDAGETLTAESRFSLLKSTDDGTTFTALTTVEIGDPGISGDTITFDIAAADLTDGIYTLGTAASLPLVSPSDSGLNYVSGGPAVVLDPGLVVSDFDSPNFASATVTVQGATDDVLNFTDQNGITGSYAGGVLTLTGDASVADYQAAVRSVTYEKAAGSGTRTIEFTFTDPDSNVGTGTRALSVQAPGEALRFIWDGDSDSDGDGSSFADGNNWAEGSAPGVHDAIVLQNADPGPIDLGGATITVAELVLENDQDFQIINGTLNVGKIITTGSGTTQIDAQFSSTGDQTLDSGTLVLTNQNNTIAGNWTVAAGGTLQVSSSESSDALGDAALIMDGGTLNLDTSPGSIPALIHRGYHLSDNNVESLLATTPDGEALLTDGPGNRGLDFNNDADFIGSGAIGQSDNFTNLWTGTLNAQNDPGDYVFRINSRDDNAYIFVDVNGDGLDQGDLTNNNNQSTNVTVSNLTGPTEIAVIHREGGGGSHVDIQIQSPSMSGRESIKPTSPNQAGLWTSTQDLGRLDNAVTVVSASTIAVASAASSPKVTLTNLTIADGVTLTTDGGGGQLITEGSTLEGAVNIASENGEMVFRGARDGAGTGTMTVTTGKVRMDEANAYTGLTTVESGATLIVSGTGTAGTADGSEAQGTVVRDGGTLTLGTTFADFVVLEGEINGAGTLAGDVRLEDAATIQSIANFYVEGQIDTNGHALTLDVIGQMELQNGGGITGSGNLTKTGTSQLVSETTAVNAFTGDLNIAAGTWEAQADDGLGAAGGSTTISGSGLLDLRNSITLSDDITVTRSGVAIRSETGDNTLAGVVTFTADPTIQVNGGTSITIPQAIQGNRTLTKTQTGILILQSDNQLANFDLAGGTVRISTLNGLGSTTTVDIDNGETLEFDGDHTFNSGTTLNTVNVNSGWISSSSGTTTLESTFSINLDFFGSIGFGGEGNLNVETTFGNGITTFTTGLDHYGYHINNDNLALNLDGNGGMLNGGNPTGFTNFNGATLLVNGPDDRGLDFNNDNDFILSGAISQSDSYSNLWIGYLTADESGTWQLRNGGNDDRAGIWIDTDQSGTFVSTSSGLGDNRGEQLAWENTGAKSVDLIAGQSYLVAFTHREGGGGSSVDFRFKSPSGTETIINPGDPAQAGLWSPYLLTGAQNDLIKAGNGTVSLSVGNTFNGSVTIEDGTLVAAHDGALGISDDGTDVDEITIRPGGTLALDGGITIGDHETTIHAGGTGASGQAGALTALSGANVLMGDIVADVVGSTIFGLGAEAGATLTLEGGDGDSFDLGVYALLVDGGGDVVVNADLSGTGGSGEQNLGYVTGYLFTGNDMDLPDDSSQIASKLFVADEVYFSDESASINFWGEDLTSYGTDNWAQSFVGQIRFDAGLTDTTIKLRTTSADDANRLRIDLDQDGVFENIGDNGDEDPYNSDRGGTYTTGDLTIAAGEIYQVMIQGREGGGGSRLQPEIEVNGTWHRFDINADPGVTGFEFGTFGIPENTVTKQGGGTLTLNGSSTLDSTFEILAGTVLAGNSAALGTSGAGKGTTVARGATLGYRNISTATNESIQFDDVTFTADSLTATSLDLTATGAQELTVANASGVGGTVEMMFDLAGSIIPGLADQIDLQLDDATTQSVNADTVVNQTVSFAAETLQNGVYDLATPPVASTFIWQGDDGASPTAWNVAENWAGGVVPGTNDIAIFNDADSTGTTIDLSTAGPVGGVRFENDADTITFTNGTLTTDIIEHVGGGTTTFDATSTITSSAFSGVVSDGRLEFEGVNQNISAGQWTLTGGTLAVSVNGSDSSLGDGAVNVEAAGGELEMNGIVTEPLNVLSHYGFHINNDSLAMDLNNNGGMVGGDATGKIAPHTFQSFHGLSLLTDGPGNRGLDFNSDGEFTATGSIGQNDNYSNLFIGYLTVPTGEGGDWQFQRVADDDRMGIWFDIDQDGVFESTTSGLGSNRGEQLQWDGDSGAKTVNLTEGESYLFAVTHREGGGGSQVHVNFKTPNGSMTTIKPGDAAQTGIWSGLPQSSGATLGNTINVSEDSTLTVNTDAEITIADLNITQAGRDLSFGTDSNGKLVVDGAIDIVGDSAFHGVNGGILESQGIAASNPDYDLLVDGAGVLILSGDSNHTGRIDVKGDATLELQTSGGFGTSDSTAATGTFVTENGSLRLRGVTVDRSEHVELSSNGNVASEGGLHHAGGAGNTTIGTNIILSGDATIRASGGDQLNLNAGVDMGGNTLTLDAETYIGISSQPISGSGEVVATGGNEVRINSSAANTYTGGTTITGNTQIRAYGNSAVGTGDVTVESGSTLIIQNSVVLANNFTISGNGRNDAGAILSENQFNEITGNVTFAGNTRIDVTGPQLTISGVVSGSGNLQKEDAGNLVFANPASGFTGSTTINAGQVIITSAAGAGTGNLTLNNGTTLGLEGTFDYDVGNAIVNNGGFNNISGTSALTGTLSVGGSNVIFASDAGLLDVQATIDLAPSSAVTFAGEGDVEMQNSFGNGTELASVSNALSHFGFLGSADSFLDLGNNGGMFAGGDPLSLANATGVTLLTDGPGGRGLDFDNNSDFQNDGPIPAGQNSNYSNLIIGTLHVDAANAGDWTFDSDSKDDRIGIWLDLDQDGIFESSSAGLGSNRGEQINWNGTGAFTLTLNEGDYLFAVTHRQGSGGSTLDMHVTTPTLAKTEIKPSDAAQAEFWSSYAAPVSNAVNKFGNGTVTLHSANQQSETNVYGGTVLVSDSGALGSTSAAVTLDGGSIVLDGSGMVVQKDEIAINAVGDTSVGGAISNTGGDNTLEVTTIVAGEGTTGRLGIGSAAGTLTIQAAGGAATDFDLGFASLQLGGEGDVLLNADITEQAPGSTGIAGTVTAYLFSGNDTDLPGDGSQIAQTTLTVDDGPLYYDSQEDMMARLFPSELPGIGNAGNPVDPQNFAITIVGDLTLDAGVTDLQVRAALDPDDANRFRLDSNQNGVFENGSSETSTESGNTFTHTGFTGLAGGETYQFAMQVREGGGSVRMGFEFSTDGGTTWHQFEIGAGNGLTIGTPVEATNELVKTGAGTATLLGDNSGLDSEIAIHQGTLVATNDQSLGHGDTIRIFDGGTLGLDDRGSGTPVDVAQNIEIQHIGAAANSMAADLRNLGGDNTVSGDISLFGRPDLGELGFSSGSFSDSADLDFTGEFVEAVNLAGPAVVVGEAAFADSSPNVKLSSSWTLSSISNWGNSDANLDGGDGGVGGGAEGALETVLKDVQVGGLNPSNLTLDVSNLQEGQAYKLQLLFMDDNSNTRSFNVVQDGSVLAEDFNVRTNTNTTGRVVTNTFIATGTTTQIVLEGIGVPSNGDHNPIINGMTLELVSTAEQAGELRFASDTGTVTVSGAFDLTTNNSDSLAIEVEGAGNVAVSGTIDDGAAGVALTKTGSGKLSLEGANTFAGGTNVNGGTLEANNASGSATGTGNLDVTGGMLSGTGNVTGNVTVTGGTVDPGVTTGDLGVGRLVLDATTTFAAQISGTISGDGAGTFDQLDVTGEVFLRDAVLDLSLNGYAPTVGDRLKLIDNDGADSIFLTFNGLPEGAEFVADGVKFAISYAGGDGNDVVLTVRPPSQVYIDDSFAAAGSIVDGDLETAAPALENAIVGYNAFSSIGASLGSLDPAAPATITVNGGNYGGAVNLTSFPNDIVLRFVQGDTTLGSLTAGPNDTISLGGHDGNHPAAVNLTLSGPGTSTIDADISGSGSLTQTGGTVLLNGNNSYSGPTTIDGGVLGGTGNVPGDLTVNVGGTVDPGSVGGTGTLNVDGNLNQNGGAIQLDVDDTVGDLLVVTGTLTLGGELVPKVIAGPAPGSSLVMIQAGAITGQFATPWEDGAVNPVGSVQITTIYPGTELEFAFEAGPMAPGGETPADPGASGETPPLILDGETVANSEIIAEELAPEDLVGDATEALNILGALFNDLYLRPIGDDSGFEEGEGSFGGTTDDPALELEVVSIEDGQDFDGLGLYINLPEEADGFIFVHYDPAAPETLNFQLRGEANQNLSVEEAYNLLLHPGYFRSIFQVEEENDDPLVNPVNPGPEGNESSGDESAEVQLTGLLENFQLQSEPVIFAGLEVPSDASEVPEATISGVARSGERVILVLKDEAASEIGRETAEANQDGHWSVVVDRSQVVELEVQSSQGSHTYLVDTETLNAAIDNLETEPGTMLGQIVDAV